MICTNCSSKKIITINAHCSDLFTMEYDGDFIVENDYVPYEYGIGGGDSVNFSYCANCGTIQGKFPLEVDFNKPEEDEE